MKAKAQGEISSIPYGMVVWSTGIGTRPVIMDFMEQIGQVCWSKLSLLFCHLLPWSFGFLFFPLYQSLLTKLDLIVFHVWITVCFESQFRVLC